MSFSTTRFNKDGCDLLFSCGSSGHKTTKLTTKVPSWWPTQFQVFFVFFLFSEGNMFNDPFCWNEFLQVHHFFLVGGGENFCGKDEGEWKGFGPIGSIFRGIHVGNPCKMDPNVRLLKCSLPKTKWFSPENNAKPQKAKWSPNPNILQGPIDLWVLGSVSFQIAGSFGLYSRKYFDESRSPKEGFSNTSDKQDTRRFETRLFEVVRSR